MMKLTELLEAVNTLDEDQLRILEAYIQELLKIPDTLNRHKKE